EAAIPKETAAQSLEGQDLHRLSTAPDDIPTSEDSPTTVLPDISRPPPLSLELAPAFPSAAPEADFFGNSSLGHQHNETGKESDLPNKTGKESDLPILPMPEGYIPPPHPPLPSPSTSMFFDLNFDSLDDAFREMQSQDAMMKMPNSPPRIRYQLDHLVGHSLPALTTSSAPFTSSPRMPTMTPTSLVPSLTRAMSNSSMPAPTVSNSTTPATTPSRMTPTMTTSSQTTPAMSNSSAPASAVSNSTPATTPSRMTATSPATNIVPTPSPILSPAHALPPAPTTSRQSSGMTADPVSPLNTSNLDDEPPAKRRKKTQDNAVEPETLTATRGKRQRFQSTRAAAANAIG
ncbi:hypothetical protein P692DRAFT_20883554, partial [Suillus brevipes Sb2]